MSCVIKGPPFLKNNFTLFHEQYRLVLYQLNSCNLVEVEAKNMSILKRKVKAKGHLFDMCKLKLLSIDAQQVN